MNSTHHTFGQVRNIPDDVEKTRTVPFVLSTGDKDRHRTRMNMDNWILEHYNANPIVGYQHNVYGGGMCEGPNPDDVIGSGKAFLRDGELLSEITFETKDINPQADKIFQKVTKSKTLRALSVGILPLGGGRLINDKTSEEEELKQAPFSIPEGHTFEYAGQELVEQSVVNIPSNRQALKRALRSQTANAMSYIKRALGGQYSYGDIESMTVGLVLKLIDGEQPLPDEENEKELRDVIHEEKPPVEQETEKQKSAHGEGTDLLRRKRKRQLIEIEGV